jgi:hypothetical protein
VTGGGRTFPVHARQQAIVVGGDQITYNPVSAPETDGCNQWNSSSDRRGCIAVRSLRFSRSGRLCSASQPGYGQVLDADCSCNRLGPDHDGHWAWIAALGWTWVDDAPWSSLPTTMADASFGGRWGWVPGPYGVTPLYAPTVVGWIGGGRGGSGFTLSFSFGNAAAVKRPWIVRPFRKNTSLARCHDPAQRLAPSDPMVAVRSTQNRSTSTQRR